MISISRIAFVAAVSFVSSTVAFAQESDDQLVQELANPVASLISVPFQNNFEWGGGPSDNGFKYTLNFQPVVPVSLTKDFNLIIRTIVPFVHQDDILGHTSQTGLSDTTQSFFFSPKNPLAGIIIGAGPALLYPTATDDLLGSEKWGAGPTLLLLKQTSGWTYGVLANQIWDYAGDDHRNYVSSTFIQPFLSYATKTKTTFGINSESTYDWHNDQWTVPINLTVSQLVKFGKMPVQITIGGKVYVDGPSTAPNWGIRFVVTPLFPK